MTDLTHDQKVRAEALKVLGERQTTTALVLPQSTAADNLRRIEEYIRHGRKT